MKRLDPTKGFTLIELLVVIAIISILAAILFPVFATAREKARQTTCSSNGRQILIALAGYSADYDEFLPQSNNKSPTGFSGNTGWQFAIEPYVKAGVTQGTVFADKTLPVFVCPDWESTNRDPKPTDPTSGGNYHPSSSYVANRLLMPANGTFSSSTQSTYYSVAIGSKFYAQPANLAKINFPGEQVLFAEGEGVRYFTDGNDTSINDGQIDGNTAGDPVSSSLGSLFDSNTAYVYARARHSGGANYLFPDGHVKWFRAPGPSYTNLATITGYDATNTTCTTTGGTGLASDKCVDLTPVKSQSNVVYSHSQYPSAPAFFTEL